MFTQYRALTFTHLTGGAVLLTPDQVRRRAQFLGPALSSPDEDGRVVHEITGRCNFKAGETFGYDGTVAKPMLGSEIELVEAARPIDATEPDVAEPSPIPQPPRRRRGRPRKSEE